MTVSISKMDINYYLSSVAVGDSAAGKGDLTGYYTASGDPAGRWFGSALSAVGLNPGAEVTQHQAVALYEDAVNPSTGEPLGKRPIKSTSAPTGAKTPKGHDAKDTREAVGGFDLTFSVPKSVSSLWAVADADTQSRIHACHQRAVNQCLTWAEQNIIQTRAGNGGVVKVPITGIMASLFDHFDSRAGDPQLHTHAVISNRAQRASDNQWVTLDSYTLHRWVVAVSEQYNAVLYDELARDLGAMTEQRDSLAKIFRGDEADRNHRVELTGVPDKLIAEFSTRSLAIEQRKQELIEQWQQTHTGKIPQSVILQLRQQATLETRDAKPAEKAPLAERVIEWRQRCYDLSLTPERIVTEATGHDVAFHTQDHLSPEAMNEIAHHVLLRVSEAHPTFAKANVTAAAHRLLATVRFPSLEQRQEVTDNLVQLVLDQAVTLTPDRYELDHQTQTGLRLKDGSVFNPAEAKKYTTAATLAKEKALMTAATTTGVHLTDPEATLQTLRSWRSEKGYGLAEDQLAAAHQVLTESSELSAIIGPAGTGKTTTLASIRHAWSQAHGETAVIGLAPSAAAARVLGQELNIDTDNVAKWLYESVGDGAAHRAARYEELTHRIRSLETALQRHPDSAQVQAQLAAARTQITETIAAQSKYQLKPGQLLIVDEASMSSTTDLAQLQAQAHAAGAKMLLVGDPRQLDAVNEGGFLGWMENTRHAATLSSVWRFNEDWEAAASLRLRHGNPEDLKTYDRNGRISPSAAPADSAFAAWQADTAAGKTSLLIAGRNDQVHELNLRAQAERIRRGEVQTSSYAQLRNEVTAFIGDTVLARQNNRVLIDSQGDFVKNGSRLIITEITADRIHVTRDDTGASLSLPKDYAAASVELGYAATVHRTQGMTVDTAHVAIADTSLNREQLYVGMTRGREVNQIHVYDPEADAEDTSVDPWKMMRRTTPESAMQILYGVLARSDQDRTAHETRDDEHGWATDLSRHTSDLDYLTGLTATRRVHQWARQNTPTDPEASAGDPALLQLIQRVKTLDYDLSQLPEQITTIPAALEHLKQLPEPPAQHLIPPTSHTTEEEAEAQAQILTAIDQRVSRVLAAHREEPWLIHAKATYPEQLREIIQWRAISGQEDAETMLGAAPQPSEKRLTRYHHRLQDILAQADATDTAKLIDPSGPIFEPFLDPQHSEPGFAAEEPDWDFPTPAELHAQHSPELP